jgi:Legionella pneumophila major outer membrane protein precursor
MKISHLPWPAIVLAAVLGLDRFAMSSEPLAGAKVNGGGASTRRIATAGEAHGLLANRTAASGPAAAPQEPAADEFGPPTFQLAAWNNSLSNGTASPPPASSCDTCDCGPEPLWLHRNGVFADLLYLRPGNIDYVYAVEQTGTLPTDSPTGPTGRVGFDSALGFRIGASGALSECSSIQASYTWFQDETSDRITANAGNVLIFQPGVPGIPNVGASSIQASADYDIRFQQVDLDYRALLYGTCDSAINYFAGLRYANLEQNFRAREDIGVPVGLANVATDINFDGFGIGFGLDAMRRSETSGLLIYGRASASFVAGEFKADFRETTQFGPNSIIGNTLEDYRVLTILQTELGLGWQSECDRFRVTGGYQFAGWFNSLTTGTYIAGVQTRSFDELWETISFDGFVTRFEWMF